MLGTLLHDIGKVDEMHFGIYQPLSAVTHRVLGLDYIFAMKDDIIAIYNEKWYRDLQSIIVEHHGEFGDPCRTVPAYLVHKLDCLDSILTGIQQAVEDPSIDTAGSKIYVDGAYLFI
jgi:3'-5' exoribonuclease